MRHFFEFDKLGTNYRNEILGGLTTFVAMAYIVIVNPAILANAGIPRDASVTATIVAAMVGTLIMAFYAKRPFAIAPYMGENAFIAFTVCLAMGYPWQQALGAVFFSGVIFVIITALKIRSWITRAIPLCLKQSFAVGIGFFIMFIGLTETGIVRLGIEGAPVKIGLLSTAAPLLALLCIVLICMLMIVRIPGAILIGMAATTILAYITGVANLPSQIFSNPPSIAPIFFKLDISGALSFDFISIVLVILVLDFIDTMGTLIGLSARANLLDKDYNLPQIEKPLMADAVASVIGALAGTSTTGTYIESSAGIEAGAKSGFASLVTAIMFGLCLFLAPLFLTVPPAAYGAALIVVGFLMLSPIKDLKFDDYSELFPAIATIALMSFTYNIGFGMAAGFFLYPIFKLISGKGKELTSGVWVMFAIAILLFLFYPYDKI